MADLWEHELERQREWERTNPSEFFVGVRIALLVSIPIWAAFFWWLFR